MIISENREVMLHSGRVSGPYKIISVLVHDTMSLNYEEHPLMIKAHGEIIFEHDKLKTFVTIDEKMEYVTELMKTQHVGYLVYQEDEREFFEEKYFTELI